MGFGRKISSKETLWTESVTQVSVRAGVVLGGNRDASCESGADLLREDREVLVLCVWYSCEKITWRMKSCLYQPHPFI